MTTRYESAEPAGVPVDILDRLLWRDAQQMLDRHASGGPDGRCDWCGWQWPCPPRRLAERAEAASRRPWRESWTARHDLNGVRSLPGWRSGKARADRAADRPAGRADRAADRSAGRATDRPRFNGGLFD